MQRSVANLSSEQSVSVLVHLVETAAMPLLALNSQSEIIAANCSAQADPRLSTLQQGSSSSLFSLACSIPRHIHLFTYHPSASISPKSNWTLFSHFDEHNDLQMFRVTACKIEADTYWLLTSEDHRGLSDVSQLYSSLINSSSDAIISKTLDGRIISWNQGAEQIFGYTAAEMIGQPMLRLFPKEKVYEEGIFLKKIARGEKIEHFRSVRLNKQGLTVHVSVCLSPILSSTGAVIGVSKVARDITSEVNSVKQAKYYQSIIASAEDAIVSLTIDGIVTHWNAAAEDLVGYGSDEVIHQPLTALLCEHSALQIRQVIDTLMTEKALKHKKLQLVTKCGTDLLVSSSFSLIVSDEGNIDGIALILRDMSEEIKREQEIAYLANNDVLTGCLNRTGFAKFFAGKNTQHNTQQGALIFIDLDNFKPVNDSYGHDFGDRLLITIVLQLKNELRHTDVISRFGGDEFLVYLDNIRDKHHITEKAQCLLNAINRITDIDGTAVNISASVGISMFPADGDNYSTLLKKADHAMYQAKAHGKNQLRFFMNSPQDINLAQAVLARELRQALEKDELDIAIQPIVDTQAGLQHQAEVLLRWQHPDHGWIPPDKMILIAEQYGFIAEIGLWVFKRTCKTLVAMQGQLPFDFQFFMNKSALEFYDEENIARHIDILRSYGLSGSQFVFELTETTMMSHTTVIEQVLQRLKAENIQIAIDDFGTGYSSLAYLKKFPASYLKIDKSFVQSMEPETTDYYLCESIIDIAKKLNIAVIAEGVESPAQAVLLHQMGCTLSQGYLFGRPVPAAQFITLIQTPVVAVAADLNAVAMENSYSC